MKPTNNREQSTAKIKAAALKLIATKGYANASLEEIANTAGFTKGAVYYHFKSKKRLILEILHDIEFRSVELLLQELALTHESAKDKFFRFVSFQAKWAAKHPDDIGVLIMMSISCAHLDPDVHQKIETSYGKLTRMLTEIISEGVANGELSSGTNVENTVTSLIAIRDGNMLLWYRSGLSQEVGPQLIKSIRDALLHPVIFR
ncbi:TetR/AcrR family transcriptional regulator [Aequoribacter sp.]|uniref:TetR/AcrR family transcriptional regulator n=1 Tax=Aequoribacter sp. TaxID=2847771 RepID=UPI003F6961D6